MSISISTNPYGGWCQCICASICGKHENLVHWYLVQVEICYGSFDLRMDSCALGVMGGLSYLSLCLAFTSHVSNEARLRQLVSRHSRLWSTPHPPLVLHTCSNGVTRLPSGAFTNHLHWGTLLSIVMDQLRTRYGPWPHAVLATGLLRNLFLGNLHLLRNFYICPYKSVH